MKHTSVKIKVEECIKTAYMNYEKKTLEQVADVLEDLKQIWLNEERNHMDLPKRLVAIRNLVNQYNSIDLIGIGDCLSSEVLFLLETDCERE